MHGGAYYYVVYTAHRIFTLTNSLNASKLQETCNPARIPRLYIYASRGKQL